MEKINVLVCFVFLIVSPHLIACTCPNIIKRSEWGARRPVSTTHLKINPPPYAVIHHSDSAVCETEAACKSRVKGIQDYHINGRKWSDIGYNFLVGGDGNVYEGRGWGMHGAHVPLYNSRSIGICLIGTFSNVSPSEKQLETVKNLLSCGVELGKLSSDYHLIGHRQGKATECPGSALFNIIKQWPHFDPHPR